jgi:hypothetical protein
MIQIREFRGSLLGIAGRWLLSLIFLISAVQTVHDFHDTAVDLEGKHVPLAAIRPFPKVNVPETELTELRRRINATQWPERETVTDATQGVQLATIQAPASYWAKEYDWRKVEARLNALDC